MRDGVSDVSEPGVPGTADTQIELPCGTTVSVEHFDMGMREYACACGQQHAVVMDVHPLSRWVPEAVEAVIVETIEPVDEYDRFETIHLMGIVLETYPDDVAVHDTSRDPSRGWALQWVTAWDATELHRRIVTLLVELMEHAVSHTDDDAIADEFATQLAAFDIDAFVQAYREGRDLSSIDR